MPNHVTNILKVSGTNYTITRMLDVIRGETTDPDYPNVIDFNKIVPMPDLLSHIGSGRTTIDGVVYDQWYFDPAPNDDYMTIDRPLTPQELRTLQQYKHDNWYNWSCDMWGTKWNAYSQSIDTVSNERLDTVIVIEFDTAWASPDPVIQALAEMFPTLRFNLSYADEDLGYNVGRAEYWEGELVYAESPEGGSNEAYEIALEVKDYAKDYIKLIDGVYQYVEEEDDGVLEEEVA
jgi:hypothetical protein